MAFWGYDYVFMTASDKLKSIMKNVIANEGVYKWK